MSIMYAIILCIAEGATMASRERKKQVPVSIYISQALLKVGVAYPNLMVIEVNRH